MPKFLKIKNILFIFLAILIALSTTSCGKNNSDDESGYTSYTNEEYEQRQEELKQAEMDKKMDVNTDKNTKKLFEYQDGDITNKYSNYLMLVFKDISEEKYDSAINRIFGSKPGYIPTEDFIQYCEDEDIDFSKDDVITSIEHYGEDANGNNIDDTSKAVIVNMIVNTQGGGRHCFYFTNSKNGTFKLTSVIGDIVYRDLKIMVPAGGKIYIDGVEISKDYIESSDFANDYYSINVVRGEHKATFTLDDETSETKFYPSDDGLQFYSSKPQAEAKAASIESFVKEFYEFSIDASDEDFEKNISKYLGDDPNKNLSYKVSSGRSELFKSSNDGTERMLVSLDDISTNIYDVDENDVYYITGNATVSYMEYGADGSAKSNDKQTKSFSFNLAVQWDNSKEYKIISIDGYSVFGFAVEEIQFGA